MARNLALIALVLLLALVFWFWRGSAPATTPLAAPREEAPAETVLGAASTEAAPAQRQDESAPAVRTTLLRVLCKSKETGAPLAEQSVSLHTRTKPGATPQTIGKGLVTDAEGRTEYEVPPATSLRLSANPKKFGANASATREIEPLAPGEQREVLLELATGADARFCGRVIARETKQPIGAAEITGAAQATTTDADGRFELPYASWSMVQISVVARGYAECEVSAQAGHETPERALVLELERSCTLVGHLKDGGNGKYILQAMTEGYRLHEQDPGGMSGMGFDTGDRFWRAPFDATGRAEIPGLPPNAPLRVSLFDDRKPLLELPERVTIAPGATREVELRASSSCTLTGVVRDDAGKPVVGLTLWLLRSERGVRLYVNHYEGDERVGTAQTDAEGRFTIAKVSAGTWRISPEARLHLHDAEVAPDEIAPVAMLVEIPMGEAEHEVEMIVHRGLTISGKVLDPDGQPAAQTGIMASAAPIYVSANGRADGSFVLGPLAPGSYTVQANAYFSSAAPSERVQVEAGARDVVLQLRRGGRLAGRIVDAQSGEGVVAGIYVSIPGDAQSSIHHPTSKPDGSFELKGLLPGAYALAAASSDGRFGSLRGVELASGGDLHDLVIQLQPGARLRVRYTGELDFCSARVLQDGAVVATDGVEKGTSRTFTVPAGKSKLVCRLGRNGKQIERELELEPGKELELVIQDQD